MKSKRDAIVLLSGGIDSTACVAYYLKQNLRPIGLFISYGQAAAKRELKSAKQVAKYYGIKLEISNILLGYKFGSGEIKGRNAVFLLTALMKYSELTGVIALGIHAGSPYYDTTKKFVNDMRKVLASYTDGRIQLDVPFLKLTKPMIYQFCMDNNVPIKLTYSCEKSGKKPCGICNSCLDRKELKC